MIRIVLVGWAIDDWRLYRQPQWMAQVRDDPQVASYPRLHFDLAEETYQRLLNEWATSQAKSSREAAEALLTERGAVEVRRA
jgi:hypothetical protein